ncbi:MAG: class I SAM-dependent methyltransferase [Solirubrobacteraceae bacterium]
MSVHPGSGRAAGVQPPGRESARVDVRGAIARNAVWYHTLALPGGILTPGQIDLRKAAARLLPDDLSGKRALDVGTFDGFWAFELERRGAEVVAIDLGGVDQAQIPPEHRELVARETIEFDVELGRGFRIASDLLGSRAQRVVCNVLELTPEAIGGPVDVAFMGALLIHLRDPVQALERISRALVPGGELYQLETVSVPLSLLHPRRPVARLQTLETSFNWWCPNWAALRAWLTTAGFAAVRSRGLYHPPQRRPMNDWFRGIHSRRPA